MLALDCLSVEERSGRFGSLSDEGGSSDRVHRRLRSQSLGVEERSGRLGSLSDEGSGGDRELGGDGLGVEDRREGSCSLGGDGGKRDRSLASLADGGRDCGETLLVL